MSHESFSAQDIDYLMTNRDLLDSSDLERLGLSPTSPSLEVKEPVVDRTLPSGTVMIANKIKEEQSLPPKKRGRPAKL